MKKLLEIVKRKEVVIVSFILLFIVIILLTLNLIFSSSLKIKGDKTVNINYGEEYKDSGATFEVLGKDLSKNIKIDNNVDISKIGSYKVVYKVKYLFLNFKEERTVNVIDTVAPIIKLKGKNTATICPNTTYQDEGYEASDDYDGDITDKVKREINEDGNVTYEVSDSSGNKEKVIRQIIVEDNIAPQIKLKGSGTIYVKLNSNYTEYGYETSDNCDANVNVKVNNGVNTNKEGKYKVTYEASDLKGNKTTVQRNVVVYDNSKTGVVYLTFDDGPSSTGSTAKILNVLKEEGVKATFFVTGNGPDSLIKREYDEGHQVALHTYTHDYSKVYKSVDNYYEDLNKVRTRVYNITGVSPKIIRFPGGSNNTVSNRYSSGIMDILTKDVMDKGYIYFDWNVSSGDAGSCTTSSCVYNNVVNGLSKNRINIVLMHDIKMFTADAIKDIITYCKTNGYVFEVIQENTYQVKFK